MEIRTEKKQKKSDLFFGEWLVEEGLVSKEKLDEALRVQQQSGSRLGEVLHNLKILNYSDITDALAKFLSIGRIRLNNISDIDMDVARTLPENLAKRFCLVAVGKIGDRIILAMSDPLNVVAIDTITVKLQSPVKVVISSEPEIQRAIEIIYHGSDIEEQQLRELIEVQVGTDNTIEDLDETDSGADIEGQAQAGDAPVIRFVNLLLSQAIKSRASDLHVEPQEKTMKIRMRVDGVLCNMTPPPKKMQSAVIARIKILSEINIAERRLPQDGRFEIKASDRKIDVRVATIPTIYGEKIAMRILDKNAVNHDIAKLGFDDRMLSVLKAALAQPHGIIIVTGPTGSGKSTTLYSALNYLSDPRKNITTVEDPVEYRLEGINQTQVKSEINLDFAACLKAILRQDPDIILIGEIRDRETVEIAIKASLTGHLVLSTFHTNDAPGTISRLAYMGVEPFLLASTLNLVIAQRLVRRICLQCKEPVVLNEKVLKRLGISGENAENETFFHGKGCESCGNTGYKGRAPIFEFLVIDNDIKRKIVAGASEAEIRQSARDKGYGGLLDNGVQKLKQGITTAEEVLGTTYAEDINL